MPILKEMEIGKKYFINPDDVSFWDDRTENVLISTSLVVSDCKSEKGILIRTYDFKWTYIGKKPCTKTFSTRENWSANLIEPKFTDYLVYNNKLKVGEMGYTDKSSLYFNKKGECFVDDNGASDAEHLEGNHLILRISDTEFVTSTPLSKITETSETNSGFRVTYWKELEQFVSRESDRCNSDDGIKGIPIENVYRQTEFIDWCKVKYDPNLPIDFTISMDPAYRNPFIWITRKDESIPVPQLTDSHLNNIIEMISKNTMDTEYNGYTVEQWLTVLMAEQRKRKSNSQTTTNTTTTMSYSQTLVRKSQSELTNAKLQIATELRNAKELRKLKCAIINDAEYVEQRKAKLELITLLEKKISLDLKVMEANDKLGKIQYEANLIAKQYEENVRLYTVAIAEEKRNGKNETLGQEMLKWTSEVDRLNKEIEDLDVEIVKQFDIVDKY